MEISASAFKREFKRLAELLQRADGQPFTSFDAGLAREWEGYKPDLRKKARDILGSAGWQQVNVGSGHILNSVIQAIELKQNNLVRWPPKWGAAGQSHRALLTARSTDGGLRRDLERWFVNFFGGHVSDQTAFEEFRRLAGDRYDLIAYVFFLKDEDRFMPIAPETFDNAFALLGNNLRTAKRCSWQNYAEYNGTLRVVQQSLRDVVPRLDPKLIDAHSFCWLLVRLTPQKAVEWRRKYHALVSGYEAGEKRVEVLRRTEQTILRKFVLGGQESGCCCICGRRFPIAFLVAAHIKRRSKCTQAEKEDRRNVVAMCRFGCDDLFERGYAYVADGKVRLNESRMSSVTPAVRTYGALLSLKACEKWAQSEIFWVWHARYHHTSS
jgi:hypothetical protein